MTEHTEPVCDCFPALRDVTLAREQRYLARPELSAPEGPQSTVEVRVVSTGRLNEHAESLKSGRAWTISEPKHVGGLADAPTPLEYLLSGVLGCFAAVYAFYAAKLGVDYTAFDVRAVAKMDVRGHMIEDAPSSAFQCADLEVHVTSTASEAELQHVLDLALTGCPGISTLREPVPVSARLVRTTLAASNGSPATRQASSP